MKNIGNIGVVMTTKMNAGDYLKMPVELKTQSTDKLETKEDPNATHEFPEGDGPGEDQGTTSKPWTIGKKIAAFGTVVGIARLAWWGLKRI